MPTTETRPLKEQLLRTIAVFQAIVAFPVAFFLGTCAWFALFEGYVEFYYFISNSITALMASGIIFVVLVQRKVVATNLLTLIFESIKTFLATGLWVWLLVDSATSSWPRARIPRACTASILLVVFFYPVFGYSIVAWKTGSEEDASENSLDREERGDSERTPLLSN